MILIILFLSNTSQAQQLAFPSAEGYGRFAIGGRGGKVLFVTNLSDSGLGSLRTAVEATFPRVIIFKVSGTIKLLSKLRITHSHITIAGQTAPGDGICLRDYPLLISANHVIVRYIRVRIGDEAGKKFDGIEIRNSEDVIIDHCSVSWTLDEGVNTYHGSRNLTIQWCLISESLHNSKLRSGHGFAASLGGVDTSYHHNLLANHAGRNPSIAGGDLKDPTIHLDFRNNVIFNWEYRVLDGRPHSINVVNNFYKSGPASRKTSKIIKIQSLQNGTFGRWYIMGNILENMSGVRKEKGLVSIDDANVSIESVLINEPSPFLYVFTQPANKAFDDVLLKVGAIRPSRDSHDSRIIREVQSGQTTFGDGIISSQSDVGGWPQLRSTLPQVDQDSDGMPDEWELRFNPKKDLSFRSNEDLDADGYTNIEEYLNQTNPATRNNSTVDAIDTEIGN